MTGCLVYRWNSNQYEFKYIEPCSVAPSIAINNKDGVFNEKGWATNPFYVNVIGNGTARLVPMNEKSQWDKLEQIIQTGYKQSAFEMADNSQLNMFYVSKYMRENVYYCEDCDAYVVAEIENDELVINMVISKQEQDLNHIAECFGKDIHSVVLGFTPKDTTVFTVREMDQDDRTLHIKGNGWSSFEEEKVMFPLLAHA